MYVPLSRQYLYCIYKQIIEFTGSYLEQKFIQIGYYVNNDYAVPFEPENYPNPVDISLLSRNILADEPRVTRYAIDWTGQAPVNNNYSGSGKCYILITLT